MKCRQLKVDKFIFFDAIFEYIAHSFFSCRTARVFYYILLFPGKFGTNYQKRSFLCRVVAEKLEVTKVYPSEKKNCKVILELISELCCRALNLVLNES